MRVLFWLLALPLFVVIVLFAVMNPNLVTVSLWPALDEDVLFPLYGIFIIGLLFGFILGGVIAFVQGGHSRRRARELMRRVENDEREIGVLRRQMEMLEAEKRAAGGTNLPAPAPSAA